MAEIPIDEQVRLRCLKHALKGGSKGATQRARSYYKFVKGDKELQPRPAPLPMSVTQEGEARRLTPMIRPT